MHNAPTVSVLIVTYNAVTFIGNCLHRLYELDYPAESIEIIVADNASADGTSEYVLKNFPRVRLLQHNVNSGFAGANNDAIKNIKTKYIALLNPDTEVEKNWLRELVNTAESNPKIGMVGSKVISLKDRNIVLSCGITLCKTGRIIETTHEDSEAFCPSGVSILYRKQLFDNTGLFDEDFFAYFEDVDLAWRAKRNGWICAYNYKSIVYHYVSASWISGSPAQMYNCIRNRLWTIAKNWSLRYILLYSFFFTSMSLLQAFHILAKNKSLSGFSAITDCIKGIPAVIKKRNLNRQNQYPCTDFIPLYREFVLAVKKISHKTNKVI